MSEQEKEYLNKLTAQSSEEMKPLVERLIGSINAFVRTSSDYPQVMITSTEDIINIFTTVDPSVDWILTFSQSEFDYLFAELKDQIESDASFTRQGSDSETSLDWSAYCEGEYLTYESKALSASFNEAVASAIWALKDVTDLPDKAFSRPIRIADRVLLEQALDSIPFGYEKMWLDISGINSYRSFVDETEPLIRAAFEKFCSS